MNLKWGAPLGADGRGAASGGSAACRSDDTAEPRVGGG